MNFPDSLYEAGSILPKTKTSRELQTNILTNIDARILQKKILVNQIQQCIKRTMHHGFTPETQAWFNI